MSGRAPIGCSVRRVGGGPNRGRVRLSGAPLAAGIAASLALAAIAPESPAAAPPPAPASTGVLVQTAPSSPSSPATPSPAAGAALSPARRAAREALGKADDAEARRHGVVGLAEAGTMDDVPVLVTALRDPDPLVRGLAERALWEVWGRSGDDETDRLLASGIEQMAARESAEAVETFTRVIERRPEFAEGWNKRATMYYLVGEYQKSLADCDEVIKRNPHHFGALSGYGMIHMQLGQPAEALGYFERALAVNPNLQSVEETVQMLRRLLIQQRRNST